MLERFRQVFRIFKIVKQQLGHRSGMKKRRWGEQDEKNKGAATMSTFFTRHHEKSL
jgi:hypothetical protein